MTMHWVVRVLAGISTASTPVKGVSWHPALTLLHWATLTIREVCFTTASLILRVWRVFGLSPQILPPSDAFKTWQNKQGVPVTQSNPNHHRILRQFWQILNPEVEWHSEEQWKLIGFQSSDPTTDFRSMGTLPLEIMQHWTQYYPASARQLLNTANAAQSYYPFAVAIVQFTALLDELLTKSVEVRNHFHGAPIQVYYESVIYIHMCFHDHWSHMDMPVNVMVFPGIRAKVKQFVETIWTWNLLSHHETHEYVGTFSL